MSYVEHEQLLRDRELLDVVRAALSHETTLEAYELSGINHNRIHVTAAKHRRFRRAGGDGYVVHYEALDSQQIGW